MAKPTKDALLEGLQLITLLRGTDLGTAVAADMGAVRAEVEAEVARMVKRAASEVRRGTLKDLVNIMFNQGPMSLGSIRSELRSKGQVDGLEETLAKFAEAKLVSIQKIDSEILYDLPWSGKRSEWEEYAAKKGLEMGELIGFESWFK